MALGQHDEAVGETAVVFVEGVVPGLWDDSIGPVLAETAGLRVVRRRGMGMMVAERPDAPASRTDLLRPTLERAAAEAAQVAPQTAYAQGTCPKCGDSANGITCGRVIDRKSGQVVVDEHKAMCHVCGHEFHYDTGLPLRKASAAKDPAAALFQVPTLENLARIYTDSDCLSFLLCNLLHP